MMWAHNSLVIKGGLVVDEDLLPSLYTPQAFPLLGKRFGPEFLTPAALRSRLVAEDPSVLSQCSGSCSECLAVHPEGCRRKEVVVHRAEEVGIQRGEGRRPTAWADCCARREVTHGRWRRAPFCLYDSNS